MSDSVLFLPAIEFCVIYLALLPSQLPFVFVLNRLEHRYLLTLDSES